MSPPPHPETHVFLRASHSSHTHTVIAQRDTHEPPLSPPKKNILTGILAPTTDIQEPLTCTCTHIYTQSNTWTPNIHRETQDLQHRPGSWKHTHTLTHTGLLNTPSWTLTSQVLLEATAFPALAETQTLWLPCPRQPVCPATATSLSRHPHWDLEVVG